MSERNERVIDAAVALSLANLCFLVVWRELLFASTADAYWLSDPSPRVYLADGQAFTYFDFSNDGYFANLELADRFLGRG